MYFLLGGGGTKGTLTGSGFHHGLSRDSREVTLQQGSMMQLIPVSLVSFPLVSLILIPLLSFLYYTALFLFFQQNED